MADRIKAELPVLNQAGGDMAAAATATHEAVSNMVTPSQGVTGHPVNADVTGSMIASDALYAFWYSLQEQLNLAGDVFDELGSGLKNAAAKLELADRKVANIHNNIGKGVPAPTGQPAAPTGTATTPGGPGADNNPQPPPPSAPPPPDSGGDAGLSSPDHPGSATPQP